MLMGGTFPSTTVWQRATMIYCRHSRPIWFAISLARSALTAGQICIKRRGHMSRIALAELPRCEPTTTLAPSTY